MKQKIDGSPSFAHIHVILEPGDSIIAESDAMASMDAAITHKAKTNYGIFGGLARKIFGGESFFVNHYSNQTQKPLSMVFTQNTPGDIKAIKLNGGSIFMQPGAFVCRTPGVDFGVKWAGFRSWFAGEGLFRICAQGTGVVWIGGYGHVFEREVDGEYIIDSGHIISYSPGLRIRIQLSGGIFSSFFSGEGFVTRMEGKGKVYMQSRSMSGLAGYLNPRI